MDRMFALWFTVLYMLGCSAALLVPVSAWMVRVYAMVTKGGGGGGWVCCAETCGLLTDASCECAMMRCIMYMLGHVIVLCSNAYMYMLGCCAAL